MCAGLIDILLLNYEYLIEKVAVSYCVSRYYLFDLSSHFSRFNSWKYLQTFAMAIYIIFILAAFSFSFFCLGKSSFPSEGAAAHLPHRSDVQQAAKRFPSCCNVLSHFLPGKVSTPLGVTYNLSIASYWSAQEQEVSPACVVVPKSAKDVSVAIFVLGIASDVLPTDNGCKFAVRSGGHTPFAGSANIQSGVTLDMQSLNSVDVASDNQTVFIGPGNRWVDAYLKLDAMDLATPGGRVAPVGVGGLTLGGI